MLDTGGGSVFERAACPTTSIGHSDASDSPILVRQRTSDKPPERVANIPVSKPSARRGGGTDLHEWSTLAQPVHERKSAKAPCASG